MDPLKVREAPYPVISHGLACVWQFWSQAPGPRLGFLRLYIFLSFRAGVGSKISPAKLCFLFAKNLTNLKKTRLISETMYRYCIVTVSMLYRYSTPRLYSTHRGIGTSRGLGAALASNRSSAGYWLRRRWRWLRRWRCRPPRSKRRAAIKKWAI